MESIENAILKGLLYDEEYSRKVYPHLKPEFFDGATREVFNLYSELYDKYTKVPSMEAMLVSIQNKGLSEDVFATAVDALQSAYQSKDEMSETQWLVDETERYCSDKALFNAIYKSISIIEGNDKHLDKHAIPEILDDALSISFEQTVGSDYLEDALRRYEYYTNPDSRIPFPLNALNKLSNGGLPPKTLSAFLAGSNVGKSALMCFLAGEWLKAGKNALYITLEMSEEAIQERVDANLLDISTDDLKKPTLDKEWFLGKVAQLKTKTLGKLIVKEYPTAGGHSGHFRHLLKELRQKKKFKPDIIFVDYINICASARYKAGSGANSYTMVKSIAEELRGLAVEFEVAIMTATQTTREGMGSQNPDMASTSESVGLPQTLDFFAAIVTNEDLMEMGRQMILLLKTRFGNKQGMQKQLVGIDWNKMRYYDIDPSNDSKVEQVQQAVGLNKGPAVGAVSGLPQRQTGIPSDVKWD
ncbi:hypothetical protein pf16_71 [Pseudomonas phage pf16]|uniref:DnaB-like replicative helicase n=1 Tax=Pseudomonas phage pf16 TaxID=1815630 RepID=A0A1S5R3V6_9CAUD|nr:hypothetical protein FDG98_gp227 [Pseudomonas phage pf16]AND74994.1 hypothetical protein pf16_71 [Pseudomonas phage pf16]